MRLELEKLSFAYGSNVILDQVSCHVHDLKTLVLIGPSGGGKSTLLRLLAGLVLPTSGRILMDDQVVPQQEKLLRDYRQHLGVVFQAYNLFPHMNARSNIMLPLLTVHNYTEEAAAEKADELLTRLGLNLHSHKFPSQLSGGQRQRVAIARALAPGPRLLLLDEPTSALDPEMTCEVLDLLEELREKGCPYVLVTHAMGFAKRVADEVLFVTNGTILEQAPAAQLFDSPRSPECARFLEKVFRY